MSNLQIPTRILLFIFLLLPIDNRVIFAEPNQHELGLVHTNDAKARYALVITIDGLRPDAIAKSNAPHIESLIMKGSYSLGANTVVPSLTLPAHTSLVTGLTPENHGMKLNFWTQFMPYTDEETILGIAKKEGLKTAMFVGKDKLQYLAKPGTVDHFESTGEAPGSVEKIGAQYSLYMKNKKPELVFIHFPEPDLTGHRVGWMSEDYINAFDRVDRAIGVILESLNEVGISDQTFIIITSDHGGQGINHVSTDPEVLTIPWIVFGPGVKKGYRIKGNVNIYDTAPTVLFALGINPPDNWDGKPIKEVFIFPSQLTGRE